VEKKPLRKFWVRLAIRVVVLALVMIVLVLNRKTLFAPRGAKIGAGTGLKSPLAAKPLLTGGVTSGERFGWLPQPPDSEKEDISTSRSSELISYGYRFHTREDPPQLLAFYETHLRALGFKVVTKSDTATSYSIHAESPDRKRTLDVSAAKLAEGSEATVSAVER
jgi:hypothetical protein